MSTESQLGISWISVLMALYMMTRLSSGMHAAVRADGRRSSMSAGDWLGVALASLLLALTVALMVGTPLNPQPGLTGAAPP
jgi:hypothetical protein